MGGKRRKKKTTNKSLQTLPGYLIKVPVRLCNFYKLDKLLKSKKGCDTTRDPIKRSVIRAHGYKTKTEEAKIT